MSHFLTHSTFYNGTIFLSEKEQKDPYRVLRQFTSDYKLAELRQILYDISHACVTSDTDLYAESAEARADLLFYCSRIEVVCEAIFLLVNKGKKARKAR